MIYITILNARKKTSTHLNLIEAIYFFFIILSSNSIQMDSIRLNMAKETLSGPRRNDWA